MALPNNSTEWKEWGVLVEATSGGVGTGQPAMAVVNADGTAIAGGGGGGGSSQYAEGGTPVTPLANLTAFLNGTTVRIVDTAEGLPVNVVAGAAGGGAAQLSVRNVADNAWLNVGPSNAKVPVEAASGAFVDGAIASIGSTGDAASASTVIGRLKTLVNLYPAAAALADATVNPTLTQIGSFNMGYNGTTWDRLRSSTANGLQVDVTRVQGSVAVTGTFWQATQPVSGTFWQATQPVSGSVSVSNFPGTQPVSGTVTANQGTAAAAASRWPVYVTDGTNTMPTGDAAARTIHTTVDNASLAVTGTFWQATQPVSGTFWQATQPVSISGNQAVNVAQINGVTPLMGNGVTGTGSQRVTIASDNTAFSVNAIQSGTWTVQPGNTANTTPWLVSERPATSGGNSVFYLNSAATTNATNIKASAGQVYGISVTNTNAAVRYLCFHNTAGTPTAGASVYFKVGIPGATAGAGNNITIPLGAAFSTGIGITTVTGVTDASAVAVAANDLLITVLYT